jgi:hypothetical protein
MKMLYIFSILLLLVRMGSGQVTSYLDATYNLTFEQLAAYHPTNESNCPYYPNNFFRSMSLSGNSAYFLDGDGLIAVYPRADPTINQMVIRDFKYASTYLYLTNLAFTLDNSIATITRPVLRTTLPSVYSVATDNTWTHANYTKPYYSRTYPSHLTVSGSLVFTQFKKATGDVMFICDFVASTSVNVSLSVSNYNMAVTPNRQKAILWSPTNS